MALPESVTDRHIEVVAGLVGGKPHIAGRRITVQDIAIWHERLGWDADQIAADYDLELSQVYAALSYYFDHRDEIDGAIHGDEAFLTELRRTTPSKPPEKQRG